MNLSTSSLNPVLASIFMSLATATAADADICDIAVKKGTEPGFYVQGNEVCKGLSYCKTSSISQSTLDAGKRYNFFYISADGRKNINHTFYVRKVYSVNNPGGRVYLRRDKINFACVGRNNKLSVKKSWPPQGYEEIDREDYLTYHVGNRAVFAKQLLTLKFHVRYVQRKDDQRDKNICVSTDDDQRGFVFSFDKEITPEALAKKVLAGLASTKSIRKAIAAKIETEKNEIEILASDVDAKRPCIDFSAVASGTKMSVEISDIEYAADIAAAEAKNSIRPDAMKLRKSVVHRETFEISPP